MGIEVYTDITVDFQNKRHIIINTKQDDLRSRFVRIRCTNLGNLVNLNSDDYSAFIRCKKPDGYIVFNKCNIQENGYIVFEITEQMSAAIGMVCADLVILNSNTNDNIGTNVNEIIENSDSIISTMVFYINVIGTPVDDNDVESSDEFSALNEMLTKVVDDYEYIVTQAQSYADDALASKNSALISATNSSNSAASASTSADNANQYKNQAKQYLDEVEDFAEQITSDTNRAAQYADTASSSANAASISANNAQAYAQNAETHKNNAKTYSDNAEAQVVLAETASNNAQISAANAEQSYQNVLDYDAQSENYAKQAKSYAVGGTGTRQNEDSDNAAYYYDQVQRAASGITGGLYPMGTVAFVVLENQTKRTGYMYNISTDFVSTDNFKDGGGIKYPKGTNVYWTSDGKWDCQAGISVVGIKGNEESVYRRGEVNITPSNIGTYSKSETYNKTEVDNLISNLQQSVIANMQDAIDTLEDTVSGLQSTISNLTTRIEALEEYIGNAPQYEYDSIMRGIVIAT